jgi:hypothetical protein
MPGQTDLKTAFDRLCAAARDAGLTGIEPGTSYGRQSLRVQKKFFVGMKDAGTAVIYCPLEEKELLIEAAPAIFYETDHYKGWPAILVRLDAISDTELRHRLEIAWRMRAGKRLISARDASR